MIYTGLVSVTFRQLSPEDIVVLVKKSGLNGIEWGGDIHVPHGNLPRAAEVAAMTADAGLRVSSYGSYYRAGEPEEESPFGSVLDTAAALGAPVIRIWAGTKGSAEAEADYRERVTERCREISELARQAGIGLACEYHGDTLTDSCDSALKLIGETGNPNLKCYWQPRVGAGVDSSVEEIARLSPWLSHVHVFHWDQYAKLPLADGAAAWTRYFRAIAQVPGERFAMLEFVKDNSPDQFLEDAAALRRMLAESQGEES